ncbi:MAG: helix-turn-helix domain-containing protein [Nitrososphaerota archaeon]
MSEHEKLVHALKKLGLSEYEARAYIALVELGEADASEISRRSGVPRTRIYDVLGKLEEAGIVQRVLTSRPAIYSAVPPERALEPLRRRLFDEVSEAVERLRLMHASTRTIPKFNMILLKGERAYEASLDMVERARKDLLARIFYLPSRVLMDFAEKLREFKRRGGRVYFYADARVLRREVPLELLEEVLREFGGSTFTALVPLSFISADFERLLVLYSSPEKPGECYGFLVHGLEEVGKIIRDQLIEDQAAPES